MSSGMQIGLQWSINRSIPYNNGIKNLRGCVFQTQGLVSVDDKTVLDSVKMLVCMFEGM